MAGVACWKREHGLPVVDPERERLVRAAFIHDAVERAVRSHDAERVIDAQLSASRRLQTELLARWGAGDEEPGACEDLQHVLRPRIDAATRELIDAMTVAEETPPDDLQRDLRRCTDDDESPLRDALSPWLEH